MHFFLLRLGSVLQPIHYQVCINFFFCGKQCLEILYTAFLSKDKASAYTGIKVKRFSFFLTQAIDGNSGSLLSNVTFNY